MTSTTTRSPRQVRALLLTCLSLLLVMGLFNLSYAQTCDNYEGSRQPFFGDLHAHTSYSSDSFVFYVRNGPREAYSFAKGSPVTLPDMEGLQTRSTQIDRPLDFVALTDHAEYFDSTNICTTLGAPGYDSKPCVRLRGENVGPCTPLPTNSIDTNDWWNSYGNNSIPPQSVCQDLMGLDASTCEGYEISLWADIQAAAAENYDGSGACEFTSFVAYEFSASPNSYNNHRNVIFRNSDVPQTAFSYSDATSVETAVSELHTFLQDECLDATGDCDVLTIPHQSNLSMGIQFEDPATVAEAEERAFWEPLVEVHQIKGNSECRVGLGTSDEDCGFELTVQKYLNILESPDAPVEVPERSFVRNVLKDGLAIGEDLGVNPFKLGLVGGTDNHNGTPGNTVEKGWPMDPGWAGVTKPGGTLTVTVGPIVSTWNPGGLAVIWAEENSRDSLFDAMRRKEVYATSGTRPVVRFFGGWSFQGSLCNQSNRDQIGYSQGVPMGGDLPSPAGTAPTFIVSALKDAGSVEHPGADLQRIQIVKGWVDALGDTHEMVYEVAGDPDNGAWVNEDTCEPTGAGFSELCTVWTDPDFDPTQPAFYYARVFENPACRYTTFTCVDERGINPFDYDDIPEPEPECPTATPGGEICCNPALKPVMQERAWTSPIWYSPSS